jgi:hypothetical protein
LELEHEKWRLRFEAHFGVKMNLTSAKIADRLKKRGKMTEEEFLTDLLAWDAGATRILADRRDRAIQAIADDYPLF